MLSKQFGMYGLLSATHYNKDISDTSRPILIEVMSPQSNERRMHMLLGADPVGLTSASALF